MKQHRTTLKQQHTTKKPGCYTTITMGILPLAIHFLQLFGKVSTAATVVATILVILKVVIEYHRHINSKPVVALEQRNTPAYVASTAPVTPFTLVPYHAPVAGCYLCQHHRPLRPYQIDATHRVGVCQDCYSTLEATHHRF